jgi:hypothetical protein
LCKPCCIFLKRNEAALPRRATLGTPHPNRPRWLHSLPPLWLLRAPSLSSSPHRLPALPPSAVSSTLPHPRRRCRSTREEAAPPQEQRRQRLSSKSGDDTSRWRESSTADVAELLLPPAPRSWRPGLLLLTRADREIWPWRRRRCRPSSTASTAEHGGGEALEHGSRGAASAPTTVCSPPPPSPPLRSGQARCSASLLPKPAATSRSTAGGVRGGSRAGDGLPKPGLELGPATPLLSRRRRRPPFLVFDLTRESTAARRCARGALYCWRPSSFARREHLHMVVFLQMRYGNLLETVQVTAILTREELVPSQ